MRRLTIPRMDGEHDRVYSRFTLYDGDVALEGVCYATDLDEIAQWTYPYPQPDTKKALGGSDEDIRTLGLKQTLTNINLPAMLSAVPSEETFTYRCDGRDYYFYREEVEKLDKQVRHAYDMGLLMTAILLNSPRLFGSKREDLLLADAVHPAYDWESPDAYISAFNMETENGQNYYKAFVEFLAERYSRADAKYGRICGFIISNEVNSQYVWGNAGEMTVEEYTREYTQAMRLAWICARKHYQNFRIYVSLDHFWTGSLRPEFPKRYYHGRDIIDNINAHALRDGNFGWGVAYHPYPEDLAHPDFYNDRSPAFHFSTFRITFKNIEMLPAYLSQEKLLYRGQPRRIVLSEQGFNSDGTAFSEKQGAAAYCLAYQKVKKLPTIDLMTHHAYVDNRHEFGLNLGIRRLNDDDTPGEAKPIFYVIRDMDTDKEPERIAEARAFIGPELFDSLLNPQITYGDPDLSKLSEFSPPEKKKERKKK